MQDRIRTVAIVGSGTAGLVTALTFRRKLPQVNVTIYRSRAIPIIGVGESTLASLPRFLHNILRIDRGEFHKHVRPVWKLGVKMIWGPAEESHFQYPFGGAFLTLRHRELPRDNGFYCLADGLDAASLYYALMEQRRAPIFKAADGRMGVDHQYGYHLENRALVQFLERIAEQRGVRFVDAEVDSCDTQHHSVQRLRPRDGPPVTADLFVDCSGFRSLILGGALSEPFDSYANTLFNDTAITCSWRRDKPLQLLTTAESMDHGWCWQTEFEQHVNRGYVFSSQFCSVEQAIGELRSKNPQATGDINIVKFQTGRRRRFWVNNVAAIGNASGFVEPLQATGIEMIADTALTLCESLVECDCRADPKAQELANRKIRRRWDAIRDFLAVHFRFNQRLDTPYWKHCRRHTDLAGASELVAAFSEIGPSRLCLECLPSDTIFGVDGYFNLLIGQRVNTNARPTITDAERSVWASLLKQLSEQAAQALTPEDALSIVHAENR